MVEEHARRGAGMSVFLILFSCSGGCLQSLSAGYILSFYFVTEGVYAGWHD